MISAHDIAQQIGAKRAGAGYLGRCPAHDDKHASLTIAQGDRVPVVLNCKAGCDFHAIEVALGFTKGELSSSSQASAQSRKSYGQQLVATYVYRNVDGSVFARKQRYIDDVGAKSFLWSRPDPVNADRWIKGTDGFIPLYRLPELIGARADETVLIVEGEKDADRLASLGLVVTTTPNGASSKWRDADSEYFAGRRVCVIADDDEPGRKKAADTAAALRDVAAFVGVTTLPNPNRIPKFDASDFLDAGGALENLKRAIDGSFAPRLPAEVVSPQSLTDRVLRLYEGGDEPGVYAGYEKLRNLYRPRLADITIITGGPNAGKSTFLDDMMVRIACGDESPSGEQSAGWRWLIFSPEQSSVERHAKQLLKKIVCKPFDEGRTPRMSVGELQIGMKLVNEYFTMIDPTVSTCTLDRILDVAHQCNSMRRIHGLVIDPFSVISATSLSKGQSEHEFVNAMLSKLRIFARAEEVHVIVVAHPTKMRREEGESEYPVVRPWDISGSAHWYNHADAILSVWRAMKDPTRAASGEVEIHVQKIRVQPETGTLGMARLYFDRVTTRFNDDIGVRRAPWETA
jgi:5S rRNA maturation endonuclease (ribonuclease M5)